jgi:hypothetical protein
MSKRSVRNGIRRIKSAATYSTQEIVELLGVHCRTVHCWHREGLQRIDSRRPFLVLGSELSAFLKSRFSFQRRKCAEGELYCMRCRSPQRPQDGCVTVRYLNDRRTIIAGRCAKCGGRMNQFGSAARIPDLPAIFKSVEPLEKNISGSDCPVVNTDMEKVS